MLVAKPLQVFQLKDRPIISCEVLDNNPHEFLNQDVWFYSSAHSRKPIRIEGISTASDVEHNVYDFHYQRRGDSAGGNRGSFRHYQRTVRASS